jgi:hypothetical protein
MRPVHPTVSNGCVVSRSLRFKAPIWLPFVASSLHITAEVIILGLLSYFLLTSDLPWRKHFASGATSYTLPGSHHADREWREVSLTVNFSLSCLIVIQPLN